MGGCAERPVAIELDRRDGMRIRWEDGETSVIGLVRLRQACPCAACQAERERQAKAILPVVQAKAEQERMAAARAVELVGRYALRITWEDGHNAGLYEFGKLRSLADGQGE